MYETDNNLEKLDIYIDIMVERTMLIERIQNMSAEHLWRLNAYVKRFHEIAKEHKLPLPIGVSDYCEASTAFYYVDKTMMIKDLIDESSKVSLFLRPRRFGKTLNMDMLRVFFEKTEKDTSIYFRDKLIWNCGEKYKNHQGKYPVHFVNYRRCYISIMELRRL